MPTSFATKSAWHRAWIPDTVTVENRHLNMWAGKVKKHAEVIEGLDRAEALWMDALEKLEMAET